MPFPNDTTYINGINNHYRPQTKLREGDVFTARKRSLGKCNIFAPVCHSVRRGGVCLSACWETPPGGDPPKEAPPGGDPKRRHPPEVPPPAQSMLGDTVNMWAVCILLECNLVTPVCDSVHRLGGLYPSMQWAGVSASGSRGCQPLEPQQP